MALGTLQIAKNWFTKTTVQENNWDAIRTPLVSWAKDINLAFQQTAKDAFGASYTIDNDGKPNLSLSLQDQINNIVSGGSALLGTTNATWTVHLGSAGRAVVDTAGLTASRTFTFPDLTGEVLTTTAAQTISGAKTFTSILTVKKDGGDSQVESYAAGANVAGRLNSYVSRGTLAAPIIVQNGDMTAAIYSFGYDGTAYRGLTGILSVVDGVPGAGDMPGALEFYTTPDGSTVLARRMKIGQAGNMRWFTPNDGGKYADLAYDDPNNKWAFTTDAVSGYSFDNNISTTGTLTIPTTVKLFLDGGANTSIRESAADVFTAETGGTDALSLRATSLAIPATSKLFLDGVGAAGDTYIDEVAANVMRFVSGGMEFMRSKSTGEVLLPDVDPPTANYSNRNGNVKVWGFVDVAGPSYNGSYNTSGNPVNTAAGEYRIDLATAFSSNNYAVIAIGVAAAVQITATVRNVSNGSFTIKLFDAAGAPVANNFMFIAIGDQ